MCFRLQVAVADILSPSQKAELLLDPDSSASEDEAVVRQVLASLTESGDVEQLQGFFQALATISEQVNA